MLINKTLFHIVSSLKHFGWWNILSNFPRSIFVAFICWRQDFKSHLRREIVFHGWCFNQLGNKSCHIETIFTFLVFWQFFYSDSIPYQLKLYFYYRLFCFLLKWHLFLSETLFFLRKWKLKSENGQSGSKVRVWFKKYSQTGLWFCVWYCSI